MSEQYEKITDTLEGMDLRQISRYLEDLRLNLLCHEASEEIDTLITAEEEPIQHYLTALSHIEIAQRAMKLAWITSLITPRGESHD